MNAPDLLPHLPDERLDAWLDDALAPNDARAVADRVASDPVWAEAAEAARALRHLLAVAPLPAAPEGFAARVRAALPADEALTSATHEAPTLRAPSRAAQPRARPRLARTAAGFAAVFSLFVAAVYVTRPAHDASLSIETAYSAAEVEQARAEVEWTLAYLNQLNAQTAERVTDVLPALPEPSASPLPDAR